MFISQAWAQSTGGGIGGAGGIEQFLPFVLVIVVFYFLLIRPQQAKAKRHKELIRNVRRGDRVVTQGGLLGTVAKVINEGEVQIEIADGVRVRLLRGSITEVLAKTAPAAGDKDKTKGAKLSDDSDGGTSDDEAEEAPPPPPPPPPTLGSAIGGILRKFMGGK